jgi:hypothetical protein
MGYGRVICPDDRRTAQLGQTSIRRASAHFAQQMPVVGEEGQLRLRDPDRPRGKRRRWNREGGAPWPRPSTSDCRTVRPRSFRRAGQGSGFRRGPPDPAGNKSGVTGEGSFPTAAGPMPAYRRQRPVCIRPSGVARLASGVLIAPATMNAGPPQATLDHYVRNDGRAETRMEA